MTAASAATSTATMASASAATPACTFALRTSLIHHQSAAKKILAVQSLNGLFRIRVVADFSETEAAGLSRETIAQQCERIRLHANF